MGTFLKDASNGTEVSDFSGHRVSVHTSVCSGDSPLKAVIKDNQSTTGGRVTSYLPDSVMTSLVGDL